MRALVINESHPTHYNRRMEEEAEPLKMSLLDGMSPTVQFGVLAFGVFLFFGLHNFLQEAITTIPGFHFGVMLGFLEVLG